MTDPYATYVPPAPPPYSVGAAVTWAWYMFRKHWKVFVAGMILPVLVLAAFYVYFLILYIPLTDDFSDGSITDDQAVDFFKQVGLLYAAMLVVSIPMIVLYSNLMRAALVAADGGTPTIRMLVSLKRSGRILFTSLVLGLGSVLGYILCLVPGLALGLFSTFTMLFIVDQDLKWLAAIKASFSLVRANFGLILLTVLTMAGINYAGALVLMVGTIVSAPVALLVLTYAYRSLVPATPQA